MRLPLRIPALVGLLTVLWVALWNELTAANVVGGLLVAVFVVVVIPPEPHVRAELRVRCVRAGAEELEAAPVLTTDPLQPGGDAPKEPDVAPEGSAEESA